METLLGEMKLKNKYNRTIKKQDLDTGMEYTINGINFLQLNMESKSILLLILKVNWLIYLYQSILTLQQLILTRNLNN